MFERFTDRARRVFVLAQEEARLLNHGFIGTEHLLLGLIHEGEGIAAQALGSLGITLQAVRGQVEETIGPAGTAPSGSPPFTPRTKKALELSLREALQLGHSNIGTEHLLLGLVREGEGVAAQVLVSLGVDLGLVRQRVLQLMSRQQGGARVDTPDLPDDLDAHVRRQRVATGDPPWLRCALCGRDLWETAHVVVGADARACEECIRAAAGLLERTAPDQRELVLPPTVSGQPPDDAAVTAIVTTVQGAFGPDVGPSTWATTVEDPEHFAPLVQQLRELWGRPETVYVAEIGFVTPDLAYVRLHISFASGSETTLSGQVRRHDDRWRVTGETLAEMLHRVGIHNDQPLAPVIAGVSPDDRAVEGVTAAVVSVFGSEHQPAGFTDRLENASALVPYLWQTRVRLLEMLRRPWNARVRLIRFTSPETADVHFTLEYPDAGPTFPAMVRRHGDHWMVTRSSVTAILRPAGIEVPPDSEDDS